MVSDRPLPLSALEHHEYCPRQCALIHADGVWNDNAHTVRGGFGHRRADSGASRMERGASVLRAVPLWSEQHDLVGRADVVEVQADGSVAPVEYKIGTRHGAAAEVQLCAQALCLEEMTGHPVEVGAVWYSAPRRRERVIFDAVLRKRTLDVIATVRATISSGVLPVAVDDARCDQCQLVDHCLPSLTSARGPRQVSAYLTREVRRCGS